MAPRYEQVGGGQEVQSPVTVATKPAVLLRFLLHFATSNKLAKVHLDPTEADPLMGQLRPGMGGREFPMRLMTAMRRGAMATQLPEALLPDALRPEEQPPEEQPPMDVASRLVGSGELQQ